ncbi:MAG TPA: hypothetical protein VEJ20_04705, partial [Candidatus Eremiobacteraceae bacterium]|nr:hypothetical protein [Candidatus Eremiobacteraceae bacterium]
MRSTVVAGRAESSLARSIAGASSTLEAPQLRRARLDDYDRIQRLGWSYLLEIPARDDWRRLWLDNPLHARFGHDLPLGWILESRSGEVVGTMGTVWAPYRFRGDELVAAASRAWFVKAPYRAFALRLMDEYLSQPHVDLFINNAVSVPAHDLFKQFCDRVPVGQWDAMSYWVTGHAGFMHRKMREGSVPFASVLAYPVGAASWFADFVRTRRPVSAGRSFTIECTDRFDARFDAFWQELVRSNPERLLADRSREGLTWHFGSPMRKGRLWVFTACRNGKLQAYCTLTRQDHAFRLPALPKGDTQGIRAMRLVDYQSLDAGADLLSPLLHAALRRCADEDIYVLEHLGRGVPKMRVVDECAPHREQLSNWKYYFRAADPRLDSAMHEARFWDPSAYDGDASF